VGCLPDSAANPDKLAHDPHKMRHPSLKGEIPRIGDDRMIDRETRNSTQDLERGIHYDPIAALLATGCALMVVTL